MRIINTGFLAPRNVLLIVAVAILSRIILAPLVNRIEGSNAPAAVGG